MPDSVLNSGIELIRQIQALGAWLEVPMVFFTFLGTENFFLLAMPALYWCLEARIGVRVGLMLLLSSSFNTVLKLAFHDPRPFWLDPGLAIYQFEGSFGIPSGHAQSAVAVWGALAAGLRRTWSWIAALALAFLIGFSRLYLAVHFPTDVLVGWILGFLLLGAFVILDRKTTRWLASRSVILQGLLFFIIALGLVLIGRAVIGNLEASGWQVPAAWEANAAAVFPGEGPLDPLQLEGVITPAATFFGFAFGAAWMRARGGYSALGPARQRSLRYLLGIFIVLILWAGLGAVFPDGETLIAWVLRSVRYGLIGFWIGGAAPAIFIRLGIANPETR